MKNFILVFLATILACPTQAAELKTLEVQIKLRRGYNLEQLKPGMQLPIRLSKKLKYQGETVLKRGSKGHIELGFDQNSNQFVALSAYVANREGKKHKIFFTDPLKTHSNEGLQSQGFAALGGSVAVAGAGGLIAASAAPGFGGLFAIGAAVPLVGAGVLLGLLATGMIAAGSRKKVRLKRNQAFDVYVELKPMS